MMEHVDPARISPRQPHIYRNPSFNNSNESVSDNAADAAEVKTSNNNDDACAGADTGGDEAEERVALLLVTDSSPESLRRMFALAARDSFTLETAGQQSHRTAPGSPHCCPLVSSPFLLFSLNQPLLIIPKRGTPYEFCIYRRARSLSYTMTA